MFSFCLGHVDFVHQKWDTYPHRARFWTHRLSLCTIKFIATLWLQFLHWQKCPCKAWKVLVSFLDQGRNLGIGKQKAGPQMLCQYAKKHHCFRTTRDSCPRGDVQQVWTWNKKGQIQGLNTSVGMEDWSRTGICLEVFEVTEALVFICRTLK